MPRVTILQIGAMILISIVISAYMTQQRTLIAALHEIAVSESSIIDAPIYDQSKKYSDKVESQRARTRQIISCKSQQKTFHFPAAPQFIIIGAQKAGTSALADFLGSHPQMEGPSTGLNRKYEAHFLDWMVPTETLRQKRMQHEGFTSEDELFCKYQSEYSSMWNATKLLNFPKKVSYEKTPSYLFLAYQIPDILPRVCPWNPKLLAVLRNPIDRAWSQFNMDKKLQSKFIGRDDTFEDILNREIAALRKFGLSKAPPLKDNATHHRDDPRFQLPALTQQLIDTAHEKVFRKVFLSNYLQRGMYAIQLTRWKQAFGNNLMIVNYDDLFGPSAQQHFNSILRFVGVDEWALPKGFDQHWSRQKYVVTISLSTRTYLDAFFQPYNSQLSAILGESWHGVWSL
jgi:Sulfotransferase family